MAGSGNPGGELIKRSYDQITGRDAADKARKLRRIEEALIARYVHGADHRCVYARFFIQDGLIEPERSALGSLLFRLDTGAESPRVVVVGVFMLAAVAANTSAATKAALRALYTAAPATAALEWLALVLPRLHRAVCVLGCLGSVSPGITNMITCTMLGNSYNSLKTEVYPLVVPRECYVDLEVDNRVSEVAQVYLLILYEYNNDETRPAVYVVSTSATHRPTVINLVRHRFSLARLLFLDRCIAACARPPPCLGVVQRLGWCLYNQIKSGTVPHKNAQLPVTKFEEFYTEIGTVYEFV